MSKPSALSLSLLLFLFCGTTTLVEASKVDAVAVTAETQRHGSGYSSAASASADDTATIKERLRSRLLNPNHGGNEEEEQHEIEPYHIWDPAEFPRALAEWETNYPDFVRVTTAQEKYGLQTAGNKHDCPFDHNDENNNTTKGCSVYLFTIQDFGSHPLDSESSSRLPEVFWSGAVHGDERVGPTSVMEAAKLLLEAAHCESLPRVVGNRDDHHHGLQEARDCRKTLHNKGIDDVHRKWLARLVGTRRIVVAPTANALGYYRNQRAEAGIDPNRDFPYDLTNFDLCMNTIAARTINEVYREHMFQLALTFHGGMEVVAYEWGAPAFYNHLSPDDEAQSQIGGAYSHYGGGWKVDKPYAYGTMNDEVYYVRGGMEDWAYAGSWTPELVKPCTPKTYGGYPAEKTTYNNSTLRAFNILVETSDVKGPKKHLGTSLDILSGDTKGNGHISRNIRLSLLSADLVEPYVGVVGVNKLALTDDIVPLTDRAYEGCQKTKAVTVAKNAKHVDIEWTVGGALTIDDTKLWYAHWDDVNGDVDCWNQPKSTQNLKRAGDDDVLLKGYGYFSKLGSVPSPEESASGIKMTNGPLFRASVPLDEFKKGDKIVILASAMVDQSWMNQPNDIMPKMAPQSHIVNARTDSNYHHESNGKHIQGRTEWFSLPLTVVIGDFTDSIGTRGDDSVDVVEIHPRLGESTINKGGVKPNKAAQTDQLWFPVAGWQLLAAVVLLVSLSICCTQRLGAGTKSSSSSSRIKVKQDKSFDGSDDFTLEDNQYSDDRTDDEYGDDDGYLDDGIEIPIIT